MVIGYQLRLGFTYILALELVNSGTTLTQPGNVVTFERGAFVPGDARGAYEEES